MNIYLYGIPNCDTMKKARVWLADHDIAHTFHDYKKQGIDAATLNDWIDQVGWQVLLNTRGMMWRKVPQAVRDNIDQASATRLMLDTPSMIKRPVLAIDSRIHVGFKPEQYAQIFRLDTA